MGLELISGSSDCWSPTSLGYSFSGRGGGECIGQIEIPPKPQSTKERPKLPKSIFSSVLDSISRFLLGLPPNNQELARPIGLPLWWGGGAAGCGFDTSGVADDHLRYDCSPVTVSFLSDDVNLHDFRSTIALFEEDGEVVMRLTAAEANDPGVAIVARDDGWFIPCAQNFSLDIRGEMTGSQRFVVQLYFAGDNAERPSAMSNIPFSRDWQTYSLPIVQRPLTSSRLVWKIQPLAVGERIERVQIDLRRMRFD